MRQATRIGILLLATGLVSCSLSLKRLSEQSAGSLQGKWKSESSADILLFRADGSYHWGTDGKYTLNGDQLTLVSGVSRVPGETCTVQRLSTDKATFDCAGYTPITCDRQSDPGPALAGEWNLELSDGLTYANPQPDSGQGFNLILEGDGTYTLFYALSNITAVGTVQGESGTYTSNGGSIDFNATQKFVVVPCQGENLSCPTEGQPFQHDLTCTYHFLSARAPDYQLSLNCGDARVDGTYDPINPVQYN